LIVNIVRKTALVRALVIVLLVASLAAPAFAGEAVTPAAVLQLESVRQATARYLDVAEAEADGYVDIGLFIPHMGWHYLKPELLDAEFEAETPELLVYADDPCGGPRRLVAVEYAIPLELSKHAPVGFAGNADQWAVNTDFQLWTLHVWVWEYNPDGVFAPMNPRVQ
jgi:hypothetical protein